MMEEAYPQAERKQTHPAAGCYRWAFVGLGLNATVVELPHTTGAAGLLGSVSHRHSRTVILREVGSIVAIGVTS